MPPCTFTLCGVIGKIMVGLQFYVASNHCRRSGCIEVVGENERLAFISLDSQISKSLFTGTIAGEENVLGWNFFG